MARSGRFIAASTLCAILALFLGAHALSSASTRSSPALASQVFPFNGHALERGLYGKFLAEVKQRVGGPASLQQEPVDGGVNALPQASPDNFLLQDTAKAFGAGAREAIRHEPLLPRAHALLIMAEQDEKVRRGLLARASRLDRRDLVLQGLVLEQHVADRDYEATISTVDQLLRVNPERSETFYPILTEALGFDETVPVFARLLVDSLPWREAFLSSAVGNAKARINLAKLRQQTDFGNESVDRRLIAGLVAQGEVAIAERLYVQLAGQAGDPDLKEERMWRAQYPPFDWRLADDAGLRAQPSNAGASLEISVRPGRGGVLAERLIRTPSSPFDILFSNEIAPEKQIGDVKLSMTCLGAASPFFENALVTGANRMSVGSVPGECDYMTLAILARSWSGMPALRGTISVIAIQEGGVSLPSLVKANAQLGASQ